METPSLEDGNHLQYKKAVNPSIIRRTEEQLGITIPTKVTADGKDFRKFLAMLLTIPMMNAILQLATEIKVKAATKRMLHRFNTLINRNQNAECGLADFGIRQGYMKISEHEKEVAKLQREIKRTRGRIFTEQRKLLAPELNIVNSLMRKLENPKDISPNLTTSRRKKILNSTSGGIRLNERR